MFVYSKTHNGDKRKNLLPEDFSSEMKWVFILHLFLFTIIMIIGTGVWALLKYYGSKWLCQNKLNAVQQWDWKKGLKQYLVETQ